MTARTSLTLFVRNLPFSITNGELEKEFSAHGPVKSAFVVRQKDKVGNRGFGYVKFAMLDDAAKAHDAGVTIGDRLLQCSYAEKKARHKRKRQESDDDDEDVDEDDIILGTAVAKKAKPAATKTVDSNEKVKLGVSTKGHQSDEDEDGESALSNERDHPHAEVGGLSATGRKPKSLRAQSKLDVGRTVVVTGLPETVTRDQVYKKFRKVGTVEETLYPMGDAQTAHLRFATHKEARTAVTKLNQHIFKGSKISVSVMSKAGKGPSDRNLKKSRLIVRNLNFKCSKEELTAEFAKFGSVVSVDIPLKPGTTNRRLGYAFVQFETVFQAAAAQDKMNGKEIKGRPVGVDWVLSRDEYQKTKRAEEEEEDMPSDGEDNDDEDEETDSEDEDAGSEIEDAGSDEDEEATSDEEGDSDDEGDDSEDEEGGKRRRDNRPKQKWQDDATEGRTLFVRNVSFDSEGEDLKEAFKQFGDVQYARIVVDPETEHSRGVAFVQFKTAEGASACIQSKEGISVDGRELNVSLAVTRQNTAQFKAKSVSDERKEKADGRNLYLAKEGVIYADSDAAKLLSAADLSKRKKAEMEKKVKLANPNFFVSTTRLCARNIPRSVSDDQLRKVFSTCLGKGKPIRVTKARIMRDLKNVNAQGVARPRGFGFIEFERHDDALEALRATNNNPEIFGADKRLIVEFSIEDKRALHKQELRRQKFTASQKGGRFPRREDTSGEGKGQEEAKTRKRKSRFDRKRKEKAPVSGATPKSGERPKPQFPARPAAGPRNPKQAATPTPQAKLVKPPKTSRRHKPDNSERALDDMINKHRVALQADGGHRKWFQ